MIQTTSHYKFLFGVPILIVVDNIYCFKFHIYVFDKIVIAHLLLPALSKGVVAKVRQGMFYISYLVTNENKIAAEHVQWD